MTGRTQDPRGASIRAMATSWGVWSSAARERAQGERPACAALPPQAVAALIVWLAAAPAELVLNEAIISPWRSRAGPGQGPAHLVCHRATTACVLMVRSGKLGAIAYHFLRAGRDQPVLLPPDLRDWLPTAGEGRVAEGWWRQDNEAETVKRALSLFVMAPLLRRPPRAAAAPPAPPTRFGREKGRTGTSPRWAAA